MYSVEEWKEEGRRLYGSNTDLWKFKCPSCGHIQCTLDFKQYKDKGATPSCAYFNCIGRYTGTKNEMFSAEQPCNYSLGGLFTLDHNIVVFDDGTKQPVFKFADQKKG